MEAKVIHKQAGRVAATAVLTIGLFPISLPAGRAIAQGGPANTAANGQSEIQRAVALPAAAKSRFAWMYSMDQYSQVVTLMEIRGKKIRYVGSCSGECGGMWVSEGWLTRSGNRACGLRIGNLDNPNPVPAYECLKLSGSGKLTRLAGTRLVSAQRAAQLLSMDYDAGEGAWKMGTGGEKRAAWYHEVLEEHS